MLHTVIVRDPAIFSFIQSQTEAKKVPLSHLPYEVFSHGNIRIVGNSEASIEKVLASIVEEFHPDTVFFLSESYPVSDEKRSGDIILPNVFFPYDSDIETMEIGKDTASLFLSNPLFLEHYHLQWDYDFESFGFSVGGIHVSGKWDTESEDFRIRLRMAYENDSFDSELFSFVEAAKKQQILEKIYPVAYIGSDDVSAGARNLWSIVGFVIGSIDSDSVSHSKETEMGEETEDWIDGDAGE